MFKLQNHPCNNGRKRDIMADLWEVRFRPRRMFSQKMCKNNFAAQRPKNFPPFYFPPQQHPAEPLKIKE